MRCRTLPNDEPAQLALFLLSTLGIAIPACQSAKREGWVPDFSKALPFPQSGSVTVARGITAGNHSSWLTVSAAGANALVELYDTSGQRHILTVYVGKDDRVRVPVPTGIYQVRLIEGQKWHGPRRLFGPTTAFETVKAPMSFSPRSVHMIDLHRRPNGNLPTRLMLTDPESL